MQRGLAIGHDNLIDIYHIDESVLDNYEMVFINSLDSGICTMGGYLELDNPNHSYAFSMFLGYQDYLRSCGVKIPVLESSFFDKMKMTEEEIRKSPYNIKNPGLNIKFESNWKKQKFKKYLDDCDKMGFKPRWVDFFLVVKDTQKVMGFSDGIDEFTSLELFFIQQGIYYVALNNEPATHYYIDYTYVGMPREIIEDYINGIPSFVEPFKKFYKIGKKHQIEYFADEKEEDKN